MTYLWILFLHFLTYGSETAFKRLLYEPQVPGKMLRFIKLPPPIRWAASEAHVTPLSQLELALLLRRRALDQSESSGGRLSWSWRRLRKLLALVWVRRSELSQVSAARERDSAVLTRQVLPARTGTSLYNILRQFWPWEVNKFFLRRSLESIVVTTSTRLVGRQNIICIFISFVSWEHFRLKCLISSFVTVIIWLQVRS